MLFSKNYFQSGCSIIASGDPVTNIALDKAISKTYFSSDESGFSVGLADLAGNAAFAKLGGWNVFNLSLMCP